MCGAKNDVRFTPDSDDESGRELRVSGRNSSLIAISRSWSCGRSRCARGPVFETAPRAS